MKKSLNVFNKFSNELLMLSAFIFISLSMFRLGVHLRDNDVSVVNMVAIIILSTILIVSLSSVLFINLKQKKIVKLSYRDSIHTSTIARFMLFSVITTVFNNSIILNVFSILIWFVLITILLLGKTPYIVEGGILFTSLAKWQSIDKYKIDEKNITININGLKRELSCKTDDVDKVKMIFENNINRSS